MLVSLVKIKDGNKYLFKFMFMLIKCTFKPTISCID